MVTLAIAQLEILTENTPVTRRRAKFIDLSHENNYLKIKQINKNYHNLIFVWTDDNPKGLSWPIYANRR